MKQKEIKILLDSFHNKTSRTIVIVFGARNHIGREVFDAKSCGYVKDVLFVEDFEYRLNSNRFFN